MLAAAKSFCSKDSPSYLRLTLKPTANTLSQAIIEVLFVRNLMLSGSHSSKYHWVYIACQKQTQLKVTKVFQSSEKIGEAPVIYDEELTKQSLQNLTQGMRSEGFLHAYTDTTITRKRHKTQVTYKMHPGVRFYIQHLKFSFDNDTIYHSFLADSASTFLRQGMALNLNTLSAERDRVINSLRNRGYYF